MMTGEPDMGNACEESPHVGDDLGPFPTPAPQAQTTKKSFADFLRKNDQVVASARQWAEDIKTSIGEQVGVERKVALPFFNTAQTKAGRLQGEDSAKSLLEAVLFLNAEAINGSVREQSKKLGPVSRNPLFDNLSSRNGSTAEFQNPLPTPRVSPGSTPVRSRSGIENSLVDDEDAFFQL